MCFNSLKPSDAYMRSNLTIIGSDNGLNQCWNIVNWTYRIKPQNFSEIFIEIDAFSPKKMQFENVSKMASIPSRRQCVGWIGFV